MFFLACVVFLKSRNMYRIYGAVEEQNSLIRFNSTDDNVHDSIYKIRLEKFFCQGYSMIVKRWGISIQKVFTHIGIWFDSSFCLFDCLWSTTKIAFTLNLHFFV